MAIGAIGSANGSANDTAPDVADQLAAFNRHVTATFNRLMAAANNRGEILKKVKEVGGKAWDLANPCLIDYTRQFTGGFPLFELANNLLFKNEKKPKEDQELYNRVESLEREMPKLREVLEREFLKLHEKLNLRAILEAGAIQGGPRKSGTYDTGASSSSAGSSSASGSSRAGGTRTTSSGQHKDNLFTRTIKSISGVPHKDDLVPRMTSSKRHKDDHFRSTQLVSSKSRKT